MKVLVADDAMTMRGIVRNCLKQIGLEDIVEAENGAEALSAVREQGDVSLVLCDWHMPVMDGLEFVKRMQAQPQTSDPNSAEIASTIPTARNGKTCTAAKFATTPTGQAKEDSGQA